MGWLIQSPWAGGRRRWRGASREVRGNCSSPDRCAAWFRMTMCWCVSMPSSGFGWLSVTSVTCTARTMAVREEFPRLQSARWAERGDLLLMEPGESLDHPAATGGPPFAAHPPVIGAGLIPAEIAHQTLTFHQPGALPDSFVAKIQQFPSFGPLGGGTSPGQDHIHPRINQPDRSPAFAAFAFRHET